MDKEYILSSPRGRCNERYIRKNYPAEYEQILKLCGESFSEKLYIYLHGSVPHICPVCNKPTPFQNIIKGYSTYCSTRCSYNDLGRLNKIKQTTLQRYGVPNASMSQEIKDKKKKTITKNYGGFGFASNIIAEKSKQTILEKYGVNNISHACNTQEKREHTCMQRYGVKSVLTTDTSRKRAKESLIKKYGVDSFFKTEGYKEKELKTKLINLQDKHPLFINKNEDNMWVMKCPHDECDKCENKYYIIPQQTYHDRLRNNTELCTTLLPIGSTNSGTTIELFIRSILDEYNIEYQCNTRDIIPPKELDIYIPSKNVAIECNGIFWHSMHDQEYHYNKFIACMSNHIQLLTLWEDWIITKPNIVKSMILNKLGLSRRTLYARKCIIKEISSRTCSSFLRDNHIQGACKACVHIGLYYEDELVEVMCFARRSKLSGSKNSINGEYELIRFCNKLNTNVVGGAGKLLSYFIKIHEPTLITSFSCNDISLGKLYEKLSFQKGDTNISYWYVDPKSMRRYHRSSFTKQLIVKRGWKDSIDKTWTESQVTQEHGLYRIYDCGTTKWTLKTINKQA